MVAGGLRNKIDKFSTIFGNNDIFNPLAVIDRTMKRAFSESRGV